MARIHTYRLAQSLIQIATYMVRQVTILNTITLITGNMNLVSTRPNKRYPCFNQKEKPYLNNSFAHACYQKKNRALQMSNSSCGKNKHQSRP